MLTRKRKKPPKFRKKNLEKKTLKKKTFKKKTFKKKTLKKKNLKNKNLVKKYKMRGGKLNIPENIDIDTDAILEDYIVREKKITLKNDNTEHETVRVYITPNHQRNQDPVAELKNNEINKHAIIREIGNNNNSRGMVRILYGPFNVANKHINHIEGDNYTLVNNNVEFNDVRVYNNDGNDGHYLYKIKNNCPIYIIDRGEYPNNDNMFTTLYINVWVGVNHLFDPYPQMIPNDHTASSLLPSQPNSSTHMNHNYDDDLNAAIAASLADTELEHNLFPHSSSDFFGPFPSPGPSTDIASSSTDMLISSNEIQTNINRLFECYNLRHDKRNGQPPEWSKDAKIVMELGNRCNVYYNILDNIDDIKKLVREREPVNIAMGQHYNKDLLKTYFNYKEGYYKKIPVSNSCPPWKPNILVYTPTYLDINQDNNPNYNKIYHILNVIGLAFDNVEQIDYEILMSHNQDKRIEICQKFYSVLFQNIYNVAIKLGMKNIVMCYVGCGAFSAIYPGPGNILEEIWLPAFIEIFIQNKSKNLKIYTMGGDSMGNPLTNLANIQDIGKFPQCVNKIGNNEKTLYINAWDCWSVPGNGNAGDDSLDGFIGRVTNIGVLGTSLTNPFLKYIALKKY